MNSISILLTISYLIRSFRHISLRTNLYIGILLLSFFLTSSYQITYLEFLSSLNNFNYSFEGIFKLITNWLSGSPISLSLSVFLYINSKSSSFKLSFNLINELILLTLGVIIIIFKNFDFITCLPILLSLIICNLIHIYKNKKYFHFSFLEISTYLRNIFSSSLIDKVRLLFAFTFIIFSSYSNNNARNIELLTNAHIGRIIIAFGILFLAIFSNKLLLKKMLVTLLPVSVIYFGLIFSSILGNEVYIDLPTSSLSLQSMTSIAFFPLIELIVNKYYLISPNQHLSFIKIPKYLFRFIIKLITLFIVLTYLLYLFTQ